MTRIRHLKPRVEPPRDRPVQWFTRSGHMFIVEPGGVLLSSGVVAWCIPATLTEPSGPVHSLEPEELPAPGEEVQLRIRGRWFHGLRKNLPPPVCWAAFDTSGEVVNGVHPDAWRSLPDDEPGDAELLEAARRVVTSFGVGEMAEAHNALYAIVEKRSGKEKP